MECGWGFEVVINLSKNDGLYLRSLILQLLLVLSCRVSEMLELLYAESRFFSTPPPFGRKFRFPPLEQTRHVGVAKSERPRLTNGGIIFEAFQPM